MSAFLVSQDHISALIQFAVREQVEYRANGRRVIITADNAEEVGQILLDENYRSVHHRYSDRTKGHFGSPITFKLKRQPQHAPVVIIKLVHCLDYQSCETDDWEKSIAHTILEAIVATATRKLPGYDDAPWGI